eukprot:scaffold116_cov334-Pavlova_lutheri.AAC.76
MELSSKFTSLVMGSSTTFSSTALYFSASVAPSFNVRDPLIPPNVLVVANQGPVLVRGQSRFAGARQTEEQRGVAVLTNVATAVQRYAAMFRCQIIHEREYTLLHLPRVFRAEDNHLASAEMQADGGARGHVADRIGTALSRVVDDEVWILEVGQLFPGGPYQHVVHEQGMVRPRADDAHFDPLFLVPVCECIHHKQLILA